MSESGQQNKFFSNRRFDNYTWKDWGKDFLIVLLLMLLIFSLVRLDKVVESLGLLGTFISLALAVIAILYAFEQSRSQESNTDKINSAVNGLIEISKDIHTNSNKLNDSTESITTISEQLHKIREDFNHQRNSQKQMSDMLKNFMTGSNDNNGSSRAQNLAVTMDLSKLSNVFIIVVYFFQLIYINNTRDGKRDLIAKTIVKQIWDSFSDEEVGKKDSFYNFLFINVFDAMRLLISMGVIVMEKDEKMYVENVTLLEAFISAFNSIKAKRMIGDVSIEIIIDSFSDNSDEILNRISAL